MENYTSTIGTLCYQRTVHESKVKETDLADKPLG